VNSNNVPTPVSSLVISNNGKFSNYSIIPNTALANTTSINGVSQIITTLNIGNELYYHSLLDKSSFPNVQSTSTTNTVSNPYIAVQENNNNPFDISNPEAVAIYPIFDIEQEFSSVSNPSEKITVQKRAKSNQGTLFSNPRTEYTITSSIPSFDEDYTTVADVLVWLPRVSKYILLQNKTLRYRMLKGIIYSTNDIIYSDADSNNGLMPYSNLNLLDELGYISCLTMFVNKNSSSIGGVPATGELIIKQQGTSSSGKPLLKVMDTLSFQANKLPSFQGNDYLDTPLYQNIKGRVDAIDNSTFTQFNSSVNEVLLGIVKNDSSDVAYGLGSYYIYPKSLTAETDLLIGFERANVNDIVIK
jgi:hypothetical protein